MDDFTTESQGDVQTRHNPFSTVLVNVSGNDWRHWPWRQNKSLIFSCSLSPLYMNSAMCTWATELYWSSTLHKKTVKQTKYSFHLGHMVFTLWKLPSNSSSYNRTQVIQSWPSNMKASATVPSIIKLHHHQPCWWLCSCHVLWLSGESAEILQT